MIISCPACTKPYELEDQRIAPLVQIACPRCEDTIILDFEAANNPQLIDPGTSTTLAYLTEEDYRQSTAHQPAKPSAPSPTAKPPLSEHRPRTVPSSPAAQDPRQGPQVSTPPSTPSPIRPVSPVAPVSPPPAQFSPPPPTPSISNSPAASIPDSSFADREFDKVDTGIPASPSAESFDNDQAIPSPTRASTSGRRTMLMTSPMAPGVSNLPVSSHPPPASELPSNLPPPIDPQANLQHQEVEEIQELEEFSEIAEEFPAAASLESNDAISSPLASPQSFPSEGRASLPLPQVGTSLPPPASPSTQTPLHQATPAEPSAPAQVAQQQMHQELDLAQPGNAGTSQDFGGQLDAAPEQLPAKSSSSMTTILLFGLVAIVVAILALCAFSLLQTGNPNPLPLLQNLGAGKG